MPLAVTLIFDAEGFFGFQYECGASVSKTYEYRCPGYSETLVPLNFHRTNVGGSTGSIGGSSFLITGVFRSSSTSIHFSTLRVICSKLTPAVFKYFLMAEAISSRVSSGLLMSPTAGWGSG